MRQKIWGGFQAKSSVGGPGHCQMESGGGVVATPEKRENPQHFSGKQGKGLVFPFTTTTRISGILARGSRGSAIRPERGELVGASEVEGKEEKGMQGSLAQLLPKGGLIPPNENHVRLKVSLVRSLHRADRKQEHR